MLGFTIRVGGCGELADHGFGGDEDFDNRVADRREHFVGDLEVDPHGVVAGGQLESVGLLRIDISFFVENGVEAVFHDFRCWLALGQVPRWLTWNLLVFIRWRGPDSRATATGP